MSLAANKPPAAVSNKKANLFVQSLFDLVSTCSEDIVGFSPSGESFEIRNVNALCDVVLAQYFKHKNLSSFFRQLNLYGFSKLPLKNSVHAFQHEFFKRDRPDLLVHVTRVKTTNYNTKRAAPAAAAAAQNSEEEEDGQSAAESPIMASSVKRVKRSTKPTSFLNAAFQIASMENHIAGFNLQGTSLEIRDEVAFTTETLPKFFKHSNLSSFVRQLNQYGFEKSASATPGVSHTFFHPHFRRGDIEALSEIARRSKGLSSKVKPIPRLPTPPPTPPPPALPRAAAAALPRPLPPPLHVQQQLALADGKVRRKPLAFVSGTFALCALENEAIGFSADGTCLEIRNETLLVDTHLETCFKHRNLTSFFRQLNMYGFYKRESPPNVSHTYMHEYFRRGREDLLVLIKRRQVKHALPVLEPDASFAAAELSSLRTQPVAAPAAAPVVVVEDQYSADNDLLSGLLALVERRESGTTS